MWNLVFLIAVVQLCHVTTKSIEPTEPPLWFYPLSDLLRQAQAEEKSGNSDDSEDYIKNILDNGDSEALLTEKRALSMFARWGPVNSLGKDRNPIRSEYRTKSLENIRSEADGCRVDPETRQSGTLFEIKTKKISTQYGSPSNQAFGFTIGL